MKLNFNTFDKQEGKLGRPFRLSSVGKNLQKPCKWINRTEKYYWIYIFKYLDDIGGLFSVEIDYFDKIIEVKKHV